MNERKRWEFVPGDEIGIAPGRTVKRIRALVSIDAVGVKPGDLGGYVESEHNLDQIDGTAWVYGDARVWGKAHVSGNAQAWSDAEVSGKARVYGKARAWSDARVYGNARVSGNARVYGSAEVSGDAQVSGKARVYGKARAWSDARVYGNARVSGSARVYGSAEVSGKAHVSGDAQVSGNAAVSNPGLVFWASSVGTENGTLTVYATQGGAIEVTRGCFRGTPEEFLAASAKKHDARVQHEYQLLIEVARSRIDAALVPL